MSSDQGPSICIAPHYYPQGNTTQRRDIVYKPIRSELEERLARTLLLLSLSRSIERVAKSAASLLRLHACLLCSIERIGVPCQTCIVSISLKDTECETDPFACRRCFRSCTDAAGSGTEDATNQLNLRIDALSAR